MDREGRIEGTFDHMGLVVDHLLSETDVEEEASSDEENQPVGPQVEDHNPVFQQTEQRAKRARKSTMKGMEYNLPKKTKTFNLLCVSMEDMLNQAYRELAKDQANPMKIQRFKEELSRDRRNLETALLAILELKESQEAKDIYEKMNKEVQDILTLFVAALQNSPSSASLPGVSMSKGKAKLDPKTSASVLGLTREPDRTSHSGARPKTYYRSSSSVVSQSRTRVNPSDSVSNNGKLKDDNESLNSEKQASL